MNNKFPPLALIQTWLFFVSTNSDELEAAKQVATRNLINTFGNIDIAQVYFEHHYKAAETFQKSA
jgi:hypothetical protein